jgi:hypothetical protein
VAVPRANWGGLYVGTVDHDEEEDAFFGSVVAVEELGGALGVVVDFAGLAVSSLALSSLKRMFMLTATALTSNIDAEGVEMIARPCSTPLSAAARRDPVNRRLATISQLAMSWLR